MQKITLPAAFSAIALLAACNSGSANNSMANSAAPATNVATAPTQAPVAAGGVDQAFLVGHWAMRPGCSETVTFEADGTVRVSDDSRSGRWALDGELMTITPPEGAPRPARATRQGETLTVTPQNGERAMVLTRCPAPAAQEADGTGR